MGCASSDWASTQTTEVPPLMQPTLHLEVQTAAGGFQPIVAVRWARPLEPNGKIIDLELYRRQIETHPGKTSPLLGYSGSFSSFMDLELLPFTEYSIREELCVSYKTQAGMVCTHQRFLLPCPLQFQKPLSEMQFYIRL